VIKLLLLLFLACGDGLPVWPGAMGSPSGLGRWAPRNSDRRETAAACIAFGRSMSRTCINQSGILVQITCREYGRRRRGGEEEEEGFLCNEEGRIYATV
jgi:hypothetical protein